jgi:hypothetical protein
VFFGKIAGPRFGNYKAGFRFGQLGYELVEKRGLERFQARTYLWFAQFVLPWTKHIQACRGLIQRALEAATKVGDLTVIVFSLDNLNTNFLAAGDPLAEAQSQAEDAFEFAERTRFGHVIDVLATQLGLIRTLRGLTYKFGCFDDGQLSEARIERNFALIAQQFTANPAAQQPECWYWIRKLQARFFAGDYPSALEAAARAEVILWTSAAMFETAEYHFYASRFPTRHPALPRVPARTAQPLRGPGSTSSISRLWRPTTDSSKHGRRIALRILRTSLP